MCFSISVTLPQNGQKEYSRMFKGTDSSQKQCPSKAEVVVQLSSHVLNGSENPFEQVNGASFKSG